MKKKPFFRNFRIILLLFSGMLVWACQSNTSSKNEGSSETVYVAMDGKQVYDMYCVACHGADGKMKFSGATDLSTSTLDLEIRILQITHGKGVMNAFKGILTEEEIENVAIYIEDLRVAE